VIERSGGSSKHNLWGKRKLLRGEAPPKEGSTVLQIFNSTRRVLS